MTFTAVILLLISAILHASWNLLGKGAHPSTAFFLVANIAGAVCLMPAILYDWYPILLIPSKVWLLTGLSGFFVAVYYTALAGAYRKGDMSIAYPITRAIPVIIVTVLTLLLGRGDKLKWQCILGILLVVSGCFILPMKRFREIHLRNYLNVNCLLALLAAVAISAFSLIDDEALGCLRELFRTNLSTAHTSLLYMAIEVWFSCITLSIIVMMRSLGQNLRCKSQVEMKKAALMGIGIYMTYTLVLISMAFVSNLSYVVAFRQLSIPLGAIFGVTFLQEPRYTPKFVAVTIIFLGLVLVGIG